MSERKHTPGPWELLAPNDHHGWYVEDGLGRTICDLYYLNGKTGAVVHHDPGSFGEGAANARLIATAPAMLDALKLAEALIAGFGDLDHDPELKAGLVQLREAIATATGPAHV